MRCHLTFTLMLAVTSGAGAQTAQRPAAPAAPHAAEHHELVIGAIRPGRAETPPIARF